MTHLECKSEINRSSADFLQQKGLYPSVVHCAYYSCIQRISHILLNTFHKNYDGPSSVAGSAKIGSHARMIKDIISCLKENNMDWKTFNYNITQLKKLRVQSDYAEALIDHQAGLDSISLSDGILKYLKSNFR